MPEVMRTRGFRFFFFSREEHEPPHIHVERAEKYAKFWLEPMVELAGSRAFRSHELTVLREMVEEYREQFILAWNEYHNR
ncbi:MAG: DUF4160 domain-containing protein [Verrucomicrobiales bacterium]|nr:DUF4160 domain-containing protein [Verrucomicrobiales bacterium]